MKQWDCTCTEKCTEKKHSATCRSRKRRMKDIVKYYYSNLKSRAKQRPKEFTITLEKFREWWIEIDFKPGIDSVDRIDNEKGYIKGNLKKIPLLENIKKYWNHDRYRRGMPQESLDESLDQIEQGWKPIEQDITF